MFNLKPIWKYSRISDYVDVLPTVDYGQLCPYFEVNGTSSLCQV